ncbi:hypothetical protein EOM09_07270 [bacterium]|nr:hypothetical protein [bacterium]
MKKLLIISLILSAVPFIVIPIFFNIIPPTIPAFMNFAGNSVLTMKTTYVSVFRLPLMGLALQGVCIVMFFLNLPKDKEKKNKILWLMVSLLAALKMSLTSLEVFIYDNRLLLTTFRIIITVIVAIAIIILFKNAFFLFKDKDKGLKEYLKIILKRQSLLVILFIIIYIVLVLMPFYLS